MRIKGDNALSTRVKETIVLIVDCIVQSTLWRTIRAMSRIFEICIILDWPKPEELWGGLKTLWVFARHSKVVFSLTFTCSRLVHMHQTLVAELVLMDRADCTYSYHSLQ